MSAYPSCQWCQSPIPPRALSCSNCGAPLQPAQPPQPAVGRARDTSFPSWAKLFLIFAGTFVVFVFGFLGVAIFSPESLKERRRPLLIPTSAAGGPQAMADGTAAGGAHLAPTPQPSVAPVSHAERIALAKRLMAEGSRLDLENAKGHLNNIPPGAREYKEAQSLLTKIVEQRRPFLREELASDYLDIVSTANPHLQEIGKELTPTHKGLALWALHPYFSENTLREGNGDARFIQAWIDRRRAELKEAGIVRVGVKGTRKYAGQSYFDLK